MSAMGFLWVISMLSIIGICVLLLVPGDSMSPLLNNLRTKVSDRLSQSFGGDTDQTANFCLQVFRLFSQIISITTAAAQNTAAYPFHAQTLFIWAKLCQVGVLGWSAILSLIWTMTAIEQAIGTVLDPLTAKVIINVLYGTMILAGLHLLRTVAWMMYTAAWTLHLMWIIFLAITTPLRWLIGRLMPQPYVFLPSHIVVCLLPVPVVPTPLFPGDLNR